MRHTLMLLGVAAFAVSACAGKGPSSDRAANPPAASKPKPTAAETMREKNAKMDARYDDRDNLMKGPGVFSGKKGYMTIYTKEGPGSSDPTKPIKVPRQKR